MLEPWHIWIIAGLFLWVVEVFTPGFILGIFGTACLVVSPFAAAGCSNIVQWLVFGISSLLMLFFIRPVMLKHFVNKEPEAKTNVDALAGKEGLVIETIDYAAGTGRAKIGGEDWRSITKDQSRVEIGSKVTVVEVEGCKVVVRISSKNQEEK